jgi:hypothetical protein
MKKAVLALAIATSSVTAPMAYANGTGHSCYGGRAYCGGHAPVRTFYGYVPGETTTFSNGYAPGYWPARGRTTIYYNGYAPYPYSGSWWWQRPRPSAPAVSW